MALGCYQWGQRSEPCRLFKTGRRRMWRRSSGSLQPDWGQLAGKCQTRVALARVRL